jgi:hypothetical protein
VTDHPWRRGLETAHGACSFGAGGLPGAVSVVGDSNLAAFTSATDSAGALVAGGLAGGSATFFWKNCIRSENERSGSWPAAISSLIGFGGGDGLLARPL